MARRYPERRAHVVLLGLSFARKTATERSNAALDHVESAAGAPSAWGAVSKERAISTTRVGSTRAGSTITMLCVAIATLVERRSLSSASQGDHSRRADHQAGRAEGSEDALPEHVETSSWGCLSTSASLQHTSRSARAREAREPDHVAHQSTRARGALSSTRCRATSPPCRWCGLIPRPIGVEDLIDLLRSIVAVGAGTECARAGARPRPHRRSRRPSGRDPEAERHRAHAGNGSVIDSTRRSPAVVNTVLGVKDRRSGSIAGTPLARTSRPRPAPPGPPRGGDAQRLTTGCVTVAVAAAAVAWPRTPPPPRPCDAGQLRALARDIRRSRSGAGRCAALAVHIDNAPLTSSPLLSKSATLSRARTGASWARCASRPRCLGELEGRRRRRRLEPLCRLPRRDSTPYHHPAPLDDARREPPLAE